jgi:hypothetical protein
MAPFTRAQAASINSESSWTIPSGVTYPDPKWSKLAGYFPDSDLDGTLPAM